MAAPYEAFARRLHQALDFAGFDRGRSRTGKLAALYEVSRETSRKWLSGLALPELERLIALAVQAGVSFEWLATGRGCIDGKFRVADEVSTPYGDKDTMRLIGVVKQMQPERRRALLVVLDKGD